MGSDKRETGVRIGFIGAGLVGNSLAALFSGSGYAVTGFASATMDSAVAAADRVGARAFETGADLASASDLIFVTTVDDAVEQVATELATGLKTLAGKSFVHTSGALGSEALNPVRAAGAEAGSFHPLQTFADIDTAIELMPGSLVAVEGDEKLTWVLEGLARAIGARPYVLDADAKILYHAAAVMSCNFLVALEAAAVDMLEAAGIPPEQGLESLLPLIRGTIRNLERVGLPHALTGPVDRGDIGVVRRHMQAVEQRVPRYSDLYRLLARRTVQAARDKGRLEPEQVEEFEKLLSQ